MARYSVHAIADADCSRYHEEVLGSSDDLIEAKTIAAHEGSGVYGCCIVDRATGDVDWGQGLGVSLPDAEA